MNNAYSVAVNIANDASVDYIVGDRIKIDGLSLGGVTSVNDAEVKVTSVNVGTGEITGISVTGVAADAEVSYPNVTYTTGSIGGLTANIQVERIGTVYSVTITGGGSGYSATDTLNIVGTELGGTSPANDASITIQESMGTGIKIIIPNSKRVNHLVDYKNGFFFDDISDIPKLMTNVSKDYNRDELVKNNSKYSYRSIILNLVNQLNL